MSMAAEDTQGTPSSQGIVAQAEALYESYLNARLQRSVRALQAIKMSLTRDPANASLIGQMRETTKEIETLRGQISAQTARTEDAKRRAADPARETAVAIPPVGATPDDMFRESQAAAAAAVMEARARELAAEKSAKAESDAAFNAAQSERAKQALETTVRAEVRRCPKCRATMTPNGNCLACGYSIPVGPNAVDFISKEEIAALRRPLAGR
jgi:hypothetical protein